MNRAFSRLLVRSLLWLLAVTLPLQGFASAIRSCCVDELAGNANVSAAVGAAPASQCHNTGDTRMQDQPMKMAVGDGGATHSGHDCSEHGACSVGATAPPCMPVLPVLTLCAPPPALAYDSLFTGHISSGPERPPRSTHSA
ncbi:MULTISPECIES: hypothetical protein [unclassified Janthinobacterium]|uniref:hypothetical protein n=1 Tax=unclassified Janthinobacterium TaxID=2610881 RepID=UPI0018CA842F|nr:hypothetical protein [Janthinobacterium sp. CG_23.4]MDH6158576.1 hypothetical protein [Janthinobacterium sp. CG_23.4]